MYFAQPLGGEEFTDAVQCDTYLPPECYWLLTFYISKKYCCAGEEGVVLPVCLGLRGQPRLPAQQKGEENITAVVRLEYSICDRR